MAKVTINALASSTSFTKLASTDEVTMDIVAVVGTHTLNASKPVRRGDSLIRIYVHGPRSHPIPSKLSCLVSRVALHAVSVIQTSAWPCRGPILSIPMGRRGLSSTYYHRPSVTASPTPKSVRRTLLRPLLHRIWLYNDTVLRSTGLFHGLSIPPNTHVLV